MRTVTREVECRRCQLIAPLPGGPAPERPCPTCGGPLGHVFTFVDVPDSECCELNASERRLSDRIIAEALA